MVFIYDSINSATGFKDPNANLKVNMYNQAD